MGSKNDRIVDSYFEEIRRAKILDHAAQLQLFKKYRTCAKCEVPYPTGSNVPKCPSCKHARDLQARDAIIRSALRFVIKTATQYAKRARQNWTAENVNDDLLALISAGNEGLMIAIDRYDISKEVRFLTYATHWVRERILVELDHRGVVRVPSYLQKEIRRSRLSSNGNDGAYSKSPVALIEDFDDVNEEDHEYALERDAINRYGSEKLYQAFKDLKYNSRERFVLISYFGLRDEPRNLRRIGIRLQVSTEWVRQIKEACVISLTNYFKKKRVGSALDVFAH